jgi:hypothetical protein
MDLDQVVTPETRNRVDAIWKAVGALVYEDNFLDGQREALLLVLTTRGFSVTVLQQATIQRCRDCAELNRWVATALTARSVNEVLKTKAPAKPTTRTAKMQATRQKRPTPEEREFVEDLKAIFATDARHNGIAEGKAEGKGEALLTLFAARGFSVTEIEKIFIKHYADSGKVQRWIVKTMTAGSVREVLGAKHRASAAKPTATRAAKRRPVTA